MTTIPSGATDHWHRSVSILFAIIYCLSCCWVEMSWAQVQTAITPDSSLGTTVTQSPDGRVHLINGGTIRGSNQFHSFDRFSVGTGDTARFTSAHTGIDNVLSRVTGGELSIIDGAIQSEISGASLFFINPAGVLFGPHASLDASGSFHVSTADGLILEDGKVFGAIPGSQDQLLTTAPVTAFGFLRPHPADIRIQESVLKVQRGKTLSIVGGDIVIEGRSGEPISQIRPADSSLTASGGQINLVSIGSPGKVVLGEPMDVQGGAEQLGDISLSRGAIINVSGEGGGTVVIRGARLRADNSEVVANTEGNVDGAQIAIDVRVAEELELIESSLDASTTGREPEAGDAGDILVYAKRVILPDGNINSSARVGDGAEVMVTATDSIAIFEGVIRSESIGGDAGTVTISAPRITMDRGNIATDTSKAGCPVCFESTKTRTPNSGDPIINASILEAEIRTPNAGDIIINTSVLEVKGGAFILSDVGPPGKAGRITIQGVGGAGTRADSVMLTESAAIIASADTAGQAGQVSVFARNLMVGGGGDIDTQGSRITNQVSQEAQGSDIVVDVETLLLTEGGRILSETTGSGDAGNVTIRATHTVTISGVGSSSSDTIFSDDRSAVSSSSRFGAGAAGMIKLEAAALTITDGGQITSGSLSDSTGQAGTIIIQGVGGATSDRAGSVMLTGLDSGLFTNTERDGRGEGNILLRANEVTLADGARIDASTQGTGDGGSISLEAESFTIQRGATLSTATSASGDAGRIDIMVKRLKLNAFGNISASTSASGKGNEITIVADTVTMAKGGLITAMTSGVGVGGDITITADAIELIGGAIEAITTGAGSAGGIALNVERFTAREHTTVTSSSASEATGNAGSVAIQGLDGPGTASSRVTLIDSDLTTTATQASGGGITVGAQVAQLTESSITTEVIGGGQNGGNITIGGAITPGDTSIVDAAVMVQLNNNSHVTADIGAGGSGANITIGADNLWADNDSSITANVIPTIDGSGGSGGNITIGGTITQDSAPLTSITTSSQSVILRSSDITANAPQGQGGNIRIQADTFVPSADSLVQASGEEPGEVNIDAARILASTIEFLAEDFAPATRLLSQRCAERWSEGTTSSLVIARRAEGSIAPSGIVPKAFYWTGEEGADLFGRGVDLKEITDAGSNPRHLNSYSYRPLGLTQRLYQVECPK